MRGHRTQAPDKGEIPQGWRTIRVLDKSNVVKLSPGGMGLWSHLFNASKLNSASDIYSQLAYKKVRTV